MSEGRILERKGVMNHVTVLFREARERAGLSIKQVAGRTGLKKQAKQAIRYRTVAAQIRKAGVLA